MIGNIGLHAVVDHHFHAGMAAEKGDEILDMARHAQRLEPQVEGGNSLEGPPDIIAQHPIIVGNVLNHRSDTPEFRMRRQSLEMVSMRRIFEIHPAGDGSDMRRGVCDAQHILAFLDAWCCLHQNRMGDSGSRQKRREISRTIGPKQRCVIFRHPAVIAACRVPEMMMGVNLHNPASGMVQRCVRCADSS